MFAVAKNLALRTLALPVASGGAAFENTSTVAYDDLPPDLPAACTEPAEVVGGSFAMHRTGPGPASGVRLNYAARITLALAWDDDGSEESAEDADAGLERAVAVLAQQGFTVDRALMYQYDWGDRPVWFAALALRLPCQITYPAP